jgi:8-oxo-dGTP diphosphatase
LALIIHDEKVLLLRRRKEPYLGLFSLPGGKINSTESVHDAVVREVLEETRLPVRTAELRGVVSEVITEQNVPCSGHLIIVFSIAPGPGEMAVSTEGDLQWFRLDYLPNIEHEIIPTDYLIIDEMSSKATCQAFTCVIERAGTQYSLRSVSRM